MNLIKDLNLTDEDVVSTKKLSLRGEKKVFNVYRIPINKLKYNKKNGRIATYISQFIDEGHRFSDNLEEFNKIIEKFIEESNPDALKKTKLNIKALSQTEPAVVLSNGIILDGNRRFTSLRQLSREGAGAEFNYLEAVILDSEKYNDKDIKRLELNLQHAIESRVDYNPIDRLVDVYRDLIENGGIFTPEEYRGETQLSLNEVKKEIEIANLLVEYLNFINKPKKFYIARKQKVDGPLREIYKILKSSKVDEESKEDIKEYLFTNIMALDGDVTRRIRDLKGVFEDKELSEKLLEEIDEDEILDDVTEYFEKIDKKSENVELDEMLINKVKNLTENFVERKKYQNARNQPFDMLNRAYTTLEDIDKDALKRLDGLSKQKFEKLLDKVSKLVNELSDI
ncbi:hypothetical protein GPA00_00270 [Streptococcus equinus]|uniref:ParB/RepB/Spo0J family partition protein n=1 Tax=Streptococcus equinus TaxID=1335 RepID=UPI0012F8007C|nr:ParB/RepB/Spo0J family partition protein [Streptococcus equinus]QGX45629.1 hypothetical protein GPA00_00270 [Streptococcus equinus]